MFNQPVRRCSRGRSRPWIPLIVLALTLGASAVAQAAARVQVLNLSPRAAGSGGEVSFDLGGQAQVNALPYKGHTGYLTLAQANFTVTVRDENGAALLTQPVSLIDGRDQLLALIGNGTTRAYKVYTNLQHADFTPDGKFTVQAVNVITVGSFDDPVLRNNEVAPCGTPLSTLPTFPNTGPLDDRLGSLGAEGILHTPLAASCVRIDQYGVHIRTPVPPPRIQTELTGQPGERIRVFAVGDGVLQPVEAVVVRYGVEPTRPFIDADPRMDGLWFDPENPGVGITVNVDPDAPGARPTLIYYGFDQGSSVTTTTVPERNFASGTAEFGPQAFDVTGLVRPAEPADACAPLTNGMLVANAIAIVSSTGNCTFAEKTRFVQNTGAVGVIVHNSADTVLHLPGSDDSIRIPTLSVSKSSGDVIRVDMPRIGARLKRVTVNNSWTAETQRLPNVMETFIQGSEDGVIPTRPERAGTLHIRFHSCREASFAEGFGPLMPTTPFNAMRARVLHKLLPLEDCSEGPGGAP